MTEDRSEGVIQRMEAEGLPPRLIEEFVARYRRFIRGWKGKVDWQTIAPPRQGDIVELRGDIDQRAENRARGEALLGQLVCIKLNGGLGTTMKLSRAKSLIAVRDGRSFLEIVAEQIGRLRAAHGVQTPLLLMNSYHTRDDSLATLEGIHAQPAGLPLDFLQHKVPRIESATGAPLSLADDERNWTPPGHGDVYLALYLGGLLDRLIETGCRWAFVSNVDNLAATVEPALLGYLDGEGIDFAMEVTDKTAADIKGGTLVRQDGQLALLERAQVSEDHLGDFEDVDQLSVFNTNNLWWRLDALKQRLDRGTLELPPIINPKQVDGRDVVQIEIAMGAAIGCFDRAVGVRVPRSRFAPVKGTVDLVAVRSDAYVLDELGGMRPNPQRRSDLGPPVIRLDPRFYKGIDDLQRRCPHPLSLLRCCSLEVEGDVRFGREVAIEGDVVLRNDGSEPRSIDDHQRLTSGEYRL